MIQIRDFKKEHIEEAQTIAISNYLEEHAAVPILPEIDRLPELTGFADNGLGVVMFDDGKMTGFLCCYEPWEKAFNSTARGTFSPIHAHGAVTANRDMIYKRLYQTAAEKWIGSGITYHAISMYAHDTQAINAFFTYGLGQRCVDAIRPLDQFEFTSHTDVTFKEFKKYEAEKIDETISETISEKIYQMKKMYIAHMKKSPCFMHCSVKNRESRLFAAIHDGKPAAYMEIMDDAETFVSEHSSMKNICGAFCMPEYRGKGVAQGLLNHIISALKTEGYERLGVDFESFNPTANSFWPKYFTAYTKSLVRRIDECALLPT